MNYPDPINADRCYPTEQDCEQGLILGYDHDGRWKFMSPFGFKMRELRWWLRVPPKPVEPVSPWVAAWTYYVKSTYPADYVWHADSRLAYEHAYKQGYRDGARDAALLKGKCDE